jgi:hypothetical protein
MIDRATLDYLLLCGMTLSVTLNMSHVQVTVSDGEFSNTQLIPHDHHLDRVCDVIRWQMDKIKQMKNDNREDSPGVD